MSSKGCQLHRCAYSLQLSAVCSLLAANCLLPTASTDHLLLTAYGSLLTAHCSLRFAYCSLLTAEHSLLTADCLILTSTPFRSKQRFSAASDHLLPWSSAVASLFGTKLVEREWAWRLGCCSIVKHGVRCTSIMCCGWMWPQHGVA